MITGSTHGGPLNARFRFDCIFYYVGDLDQAIGFYSEMLGLTLSSRDLVARFRIDGVLFELVPRKDKMDEAGQGNARLCLSVDDILATVTDLKAKGVVVGEVREVEGGRWASVHDPDNNEIVLWEYEDSSGANTTATWPVLRPSWIV